VKVPCIHCAARIIWHPDWGRTDVAACRDCKAALEHLGRARTKERAGDNVIAFALSEHSRQIEAAELAARYLGGMGDWLDAASAMAHAARKGPESKRGEYMARAHGLAQRVAELLPEVLAMLQGSTPALPEPPQLELLNGEEAAEGGRR